MRSPIFGIPRKMLLNICLGTVLVSGVAAQYEPRILFAAELVAVACSLIGVFVLFSSPSHENSHVTEIQEDLSFPSENITAENSEQPISSSVFQYAAPADYIPAPLLSEADVKWLFENGLAASRKNEGATAAIYTPSFTPSFEKLAAREVSYRKVELNRLHRSSMVLGQVVQPRRYTSNSLRGLMEWSDIVRPSFPDNIDPVTSQGAALNAQPLQAVH